MRKTKKIASALLAGIVSLTTFNSALMLNANAITVNNTQSNIVEYLDRGISAVNTGSGMLVNWRFLASDPDDAVFKLYRGSDLIDTSTQTV